MPGALLVMELHLPQAASLKDKRQVLRHLLDTSRQRYRVAAAETEHQGLRQRATVTFAAVSGEVGHVEEILDSVERFVWSHGELEVLGAERHFFEEG